MRKPLNHFLLEAGSLAANIESAAHRTAAVRELSQELAGGDDARIHLVRALREAAMAANAMSTPDARAQVADGIRGIIRAARAEPIVSRDKAMVDAAPRRYWVDHP